ncbi:MAG: LPP20 family lipoprotein [Bacteroidaceae bacterium]|nr:LPP20 family lipoprotein [Bacteroidaceae bacterium]
MKKMIFMLVAAMMCTMTMTAQSAIELAKDQRELNKVNTKMLNQKPTRDAKKQARQLKKAGWLVPVGEKTIEKQLTESQLLGEELMVDETGSPTRRYIQHTASQVAGTYNAGYAAARNAAIVELAANLKTQVAAAMQAKLDNSQNSSISTATIDKFNQRARAIVDASLTNTRAVVALYRERPNNNYEVQVRLAYDKKELAARLKRAMQQELEMEGDELDGLVDEVMKNHI